MAEERTGDSPLLRYMGQIGWADRKFDRLLNGTISHSGAEPGRGASEPGDDVEFWSEHKYRGDVVRRSLRLLR